VTSIPVLCAASSSSLRIVRDFPANFPPPGTSGSIASAIMSTTGRAFNEGVGKQSFEYDTQVRLPGTALLHLACRLVHDFREFWENKYDEADSLDDDNLMEEASFYVDNCRQTQWLIDSKQSEGIQPQESKYAFKQRHNKGESV
jgi:hypothetical protein